MQKGVRPFAFRLSHFDMLGGMIRRLLSLAAAVALCSCAQSSGDANGRVATPEDARKFLTEANETMLKLGTASSQAAWAYSTYITADTEALNARANQQYIEAVAKYAKDATRFDQVELSAEERRQMDLLKLSLTLVTPQDPKKAEELTRIAAAMEGAYGKGKWCSASAGDEDGCLDVEEITEIMATSRDPKRLREVWEGWHTISPPIKKDFVRYVELANEGARELGFKDTGAMWRSKYDLPPDEFAKEVDRLWEQVRPLYTALHAYVRMKLGEKYGDQIPANGPLPAHLLGNIWAQDWANVFPLVSAAGADPGYDLTAILKARKMTPVDMVRAGERFYTSLGFAPLPQTFWERSLLSKPRDREVVCHASAWDVDSVEDLRIKMCIDATAEDFQTIHHELGHNIYQRAYNKLPVLFRNSAHEGFHEAIGAVGHARISRQDWSAVEGARCVA
jgi:peptidyl-dipeptidase A